MNSEINNVLKIFIEELKKIFKDKLYSFLIYGSVVLNDFTVGKGDIDFMVVLNDDINEFEINKIISLHENLRNYKLGILGKQLEGSYYTKQMFIDRNRNHQGYYVGTSRKGWRVVNNINVNCFDKLNIIDNGMILYGADIRNLIQSPSINDLKLLFINELENRINFLKTYKSTSFLIDTVYLTLRGVSICELGKLVSKSESVKNYLQIINDEEGVKFIEYISKFRLPLAQNEIEIIDDKYIEQCSIYWLKKIYLKYNLVNRKNHTK